MAELTRLLSDIYGKKDSSDSEEVEETSEATNSDAMESFSEELAEALPAWNDDEHLDEFFSSWNSGPDAYASPNEHEIIAESANDAVEGHWESSVDWSKSTDIDAPVEHENGFEDWDGFDSNELDSNEFDSNDLYSSEIADNEELTDTSAWTTPDSQAVDHDPIPQPTHLPNWEAEASWSAQIPEAPTKEPASVVPTVRQTGWTRAHDDILPSGVAKASRRLFGR